MWTVNADKLGQAKWTSDSIALAVDARGGSHGIHVDGDDGQQWFRLDAIEGKELSPVAEQYIRGDELHLWLPQGDNEFGIKLTLCPASASDCDAFVLQATVSIQTTLLDSHPKLDIIAAAKSTRCVGESPATGSPAVSIADRVDKSVAVVLGKHDSPFTTNHTKSNEVALRLFGDFLEKGVIRKARAWFVMSQKGESVRDKSLLTCVDQLSNSPLPLAP
ncbi:MAG: hypothetical protein WBD20_26800 [Pirellulaceae bacterium]